MGSPKSLYNHVATSHIEQLSARVERLSLKSTQISENAVESSRARQLLVLFFYLIIFVECHVLVI